MLRHIAISLSAWLVIIVTTGDYASAHFGFNDGHTWDGIGIVVFGGAIAVIGLLAYLAFSGRDSESEESEQDG